jgi:hypothetical protein
VCAVMILFLTHAATLFFSYFFFWYFLYLRSMLARASTVRAVVIVEVRMRMPLMRTRMLLRLTCIHDLKTYLQT